MSRTIRRRNAKPRKAWYNGDHWRYHTDSDYPWRGWTQALKHFTDTRRRCDDRVDIHRLIKDSDADVYSREKLYLGYLWNFD